MRLKMANAVEGCWYSLRKVVPGSLSRYSNEARVETDILKVSISQELNCHRFIMVPGRCSCALQGSSAAWSTYFWSVSGKCSVATSRDVRGGFTSKPQPAFFYIPKYPQSLARWRLLDLLDRYVACSYFTGSSLIYGRC
jgi:hypothetical protein